MSNIGGYMGIKKLITKFLIIVIKLLEPRERMDLFLSLSIEIDKDMRMFGIHPLCNSLEKELLKLIE